MNTLPLSQVTAYLLLRGDSFPCPRRGHPPFLHEKDDPCVALYFRKRLVRVIPASRLAAADRAVFRGGVERHYWAVTPGEVKRLAKWATRKARARRDPAAPSKPRKQVNVVAPKWKHNPRARHHPFAVRALLEDCDYLDKLSPNDRAFMNQFFEETALNRWRAQPFYPKGSEARRKLQFEYNRRYEDILNRAEMRPVSPDPQVREGGIRYSRHEGMRSIFDILPARAPTEDDLIAEIDRSRE